MEFKSVLDNLKIQQLNLNDTQKELFCHALEKTVIHKGELLLSIGQICRYDFFVSKGCFKVCYYDGKGVEHIIKFAPENTWVVDLDSFLNRTKSFYFIEAIEDCEVFQISLKNYEMLYQKIPSLHEVSSKRWQQGFIALQHRLIQSHSLSANERYTYFKKKYPGLEKRLSQKMIASYLGVTPQFFSKLKSQNFRKRVNVD